MTDAQISEVAKMLDQQGLTELIHSSASEQVAYLLVERASLLEMSEVTGDGNTASPLQTEGQVSNSNTRKVRGPHLLTSQLKEVGEINFSATATVYVKEKVIYSFQ